MLKVWNVSLVLATGTLAIMGTFLVRSGMLNSIHAFGGATLGVPFVCLIGVLIAGSIYLVVARREMLRSEHRLDSLLSRESIFLLNNLVLVGLCFVIFWGTYFPLISEALTGHESSVGPPWFDRYTVPLALLLVLLSGIGPVIAWRRATLVNARRNFLAPAGRGAARRWRVAADRGRRAQAAGDDDVLLRRLRASAASAQEFVRGARARRAMAGESRAGGAARARPPQPPPLRRLRRAHRHRGAVHRRRGLLVLPARQSSSACARASRRTSAPTPSRYVQAHGDGHAEVRRAHTGSTLGSGRDARREQGRHARRDARPERGLLRLRRNRRRGRSAA